MSPTQRSDRQLSELSTPQRNRYFYGKLMDVLHFDLEQEYLIAEQRRSNRLLLGPGVVCGLQVEVIRSGGERGLRVGPGLAIDGWGRRILVPDEVELLPLRLTDEDGVPVPDDGPLPRQLVLSLCYSECRTGFEPALVPDPLCDGPRHSEAGRWVETYAMYVHEGTADDVVRECTSDLGELLREGRIQEALCLLAADCPDPPADPCVVLANIAVGPRGALKIAPCLPRPVVPTNRMLLQLLICLNERIEECCRHDTVLLKVGAVRLLMGNGPDVVLDSPDERRVILRGSEPLGFEAEFTGAPVDQASIAMGGSVEVLRDGTPVALPVEWPAPQRLRCAVRNALEPGAYTVTLRGERPAIMSVGQSPDDAEPLDGEAGRQWPSGNGTPGGNFHFSFQVDR
ncbi:hypothetical protein [Streptomyces flaveus]|uniref:hypothetical protein n=1 Tax=Streptomyces flaveus TaxID=66370 RepID=UPI00331FF43B